MVLFLITTGQQQGTVDKTFNPQLGFVFNNNAFPLPGKVSTFNKKSQQEQLQTAK